MTDECLGREGQRVAVTASMRVRVLPPHRLHTAPRTARARAHARPHARACRPVSHAAAAGRLQRQMPPPTPRATCPSRSDLVWAQSCTISTVTRVLIGRLPRRQGVWFVGLLNRLGAPRPGRSHPLTTATNENLAW